MHASYVRKTWFTYIVTLLAFSNDALKTLLNVIKIHISLYQL